MDTWHKVWCQFRITQNVNQLAWPNKQGNFHVNPTTETTSTLSTMIAFSSNTANMWIFYRFFFQKLDPLIMLWSGYVNLRNGSFSSSLFFNSSSTQHRDAFVLEQMFALMATVAAMTAMLLHYTDDIKMWRMIQVVLLIWNFMCMNDTTHAVRLAGPFERVSKGVNCIYCVEVCTIVIIVRLCFLMGVGIWRPQIRNGVLYQR